MKRFRLTLILLTACSVVIGSAPATAQRGATHQELARARSATAEYHNVERALADGYVNTGFYEPGEGLHFVNPALIDAIFEIERPEVLLYVPNPGGQLRLVAVEYIVPLGLSERAPDGFTGDLDVWREDREEFGLWELTAWLWLHNPLGMFNFINSRVP
jgi:hypothetical protein